jgi:hypothetical protein
MNIFRQSLEDIRAETDPRRDDFDPLPGLPDFLSVEGTAYVLNVSKQTVERMIRAGDLRQTPEERVSKAEMIRYISSHALADLPVL